MKPDVITNGLYIPPEEQILSECLIRISGRVIIPSPNKDVCDITTMFVKVVDIDLAQYKSALDTLLDATIQIIRKEP